jgi:hypothetical protein
LARVSRARTVDMAEDAVGTRAALDAITTTPTPCGAV